MALLTQRTVLVSSVLVLAPALVALRQTTARSWAPARRHLVVLDHGPHWPATPDAPGMKTLMEHGAYVQRLMGEGKVLIGGPAPDRAYGVEVLDVAERAEVERLLADDPAVKAGVLVPEVKPFEGMRAEDTWPAPKLPSTPAGLEPLSFEVTVAAPLADVWRAWSTEEGAESFFAPKVHLELAPLGRFEVLFSPDAPPGQRGAEDLRILAYAPERMLAFEWSAPPSFARARAARTFVVVELEPAGAARTRVTLLHQGFAEQAARTPDAAAEWRDVRAYFDKAWPTVLAALEQRFAKGPLGGSAERAAK